MKAAQIQEVQKIAEVASQGDRDALEALCKLCYKEVYDKVLANVPAEDAEDVTQDIFLHLTRNIGTYRGGSSFKTWFFCLSRNRIVDYYRKRGVRLRYVPDRVTVDARKVMHPERVRKTEQSHSSLYFEEMIQSLPTSYRQIILMRLGQSMSFGEIATILGLSYEAVRATYRRAIAKAGKNITEELDGLVWN